MFKYGMIIVLLVIFLSFSSVQALKPFEVDLVCSSFLNSDSKYSIGNLFDNDIKTCWAEGVSSDGSGIMRDKIYVHCDQWSILPDSGAAEQFWGDFTPFPPQNMKITKMRIYNGYGKSDILWKANNRVKKLGMIIDGYQGEIINNDFTHNYTYKLGISLQNKGWNDIEFSNYLKKDESINYVTQIKFYILETYKGSKYKE